MKEEAYYSKTILFSALEMYHRTMREGKIAHLCHQQGKNFKQEDRKRIQRDGWRESRKMMIHIYSPLHSFLCISLLFFMHRERKVFKSLLETFFYSAI